MPVSGDGVTKEVIKVNEVTGVGPAPIGLVSLEIRTQRTEGRPREDTGRGQPSTGQGGRPEEGPALWHLTGDFQPLKS